MLNDFILSKKIREGDIKTFEKIFKLYYVSLCIYAFSIMGRKDIAEETVQDVFYNIWKNRENLHIRSSIKNYLFGAVKNHSLRYKEHLAIQERYADYLRSNEGPEIDRLPPELMEYKELEDIVTSILKKLPARRMNIFLMHRMEGKKYTEIAEYYSISVKTVEAEMTKVYRALRQVIEHYTLNHEF